MVKSSAAPSSELGAAESLEKPTRRREERTPTNTAALERLHATSGNSAVGRVLRVSRQSHDPLAGIRSELGKSGEALDPQTRLETEDHFSRERPDARIHRDGGAAQAASAANASAFSVSNHVVLGASVPALSSREGRRVLAHELVHVLQHPGPSSLRLVPPGSLAERQAAHASQGASAVAVTPTAGGLARLIEKDLTQLSEDDPWAEYQLVWRSLADNPTGTDHDAAMAYMQEIEQEVSKRSNKRAGQQQSATEPATMTPNQSMSGTLESHQGATSSNQSEQNASFSPPASSIVSSASGVSSSAPETGVRQVSPKATKGEQDPRLRFNAALSHNAWSDAARALAEMEPSDRLAGLQALSPEARFSLRKASGELDPSPSNPVTSDIDSVEQTASSTKTSAPTAQRAQPGAADVSAMSSTEKLERAWGYASEKIGPDIRAQLAGLFTPESLLWMAGFALAYVAAQVTPAGWVADGVALITLGISAIFVGRTLIDVAEGLGEFFGAVFAANDQQLRASGAALSHAIAVGGVAIVMALLTRKVGGRGGGTPYEGPPPTGMVEVLTSEGILVRVPASAVIEAAPASALQVAASYAVAGPPPGSGGFSSQGGGGGGGGGQGPTPDARGPEVFDEISHELDLDPADLEAEVDPAKAASEAQAGGLVGAKGAPGTVDLATQTHSVASDIRGEYGVKGSDVQSAHIGPTSFLRDVPKYSRGGAETVLMDQPVHRAFDQTWKDWAMGQRRAGKTSVAVSELYSVMLDAINRIPGLSQRAKNAMAWRLQLELFRDLNLKPTDNVTLPYANIPAAK